MAPHDMNRPTGQMVGINPSLGPQHLPGRPPTIGWALAQTIVAPAVPRTG